MALSRNARRKAAQARLAAKSARIANASEAARLNEVRAIVKANKAKPIERNYFKQACPLGKLTADRMGARAHVFGERRPLPDGFERSDGKRHNIDK
jgi:hypothetical protein